ncbi:alpha/beta fold hydrolase [Streptomyces cavernicola]|uniref:Alpha/beta hydrolase n=1 Tax=Streptomyces cavernicola TaxID=3043613 RepID=A0ABT6S9W5_9ACTN|nr:alpha/beta hydrolase [Streptomyces sp. B-S-A6]MDI3404958.1 alpha/beta hydrolase [Streptomyces sp. B-S-A6]
MSRPPSLALAPNCRAHSLNTARGTFAVLDARPLPGTSEQGTVLLMPGFIGSKEDFLPLLAPLASAGFRAVAVDGRGQYESDGPGSESAYAQRELAADVMAQTLALTAGAPHPAVHLLGHSLGGLIGRAAVLDVAPAPCPWASLTLLASGPAAVCPEQQVRLQHLLGALPAVGMETVWQELHRIERYGELPQDVEEFLRRRWFGTDPRQLLAAGRQLLVEPDRVDALAAAGLPVHVVSGSEDYAWPVTWQDAMATRLGARRTVIAGGSHSPQVEFPAETAAALVSFWTSVESGDRRRPVGMGLQM